MIRIRDFSKKYGRNIIYNNLNLDIPGGIVFVIGNNGSGKTTLLNCIARYIPYKGTISIGKAFTYFPEKRGFFNDYKTKDTIGFCNGMRGNETLSDKWKKYAKLLNFDINSPLTYEKLSKGNKSKLLFLCALLGDEDIIIMDEPTDGFDLESKEQFKNLIRQFEDEGKNVIISTHDRDLIHSFPNKVKIDVGEIRK